MLNDIFKEKKKSIKKFKKEKIIIDFREKNSLVPSELIKQNLEIEFRELKIGDYLLKKTIIERKTYSDFIQSMINKRLFSQLKEIKQYPNYLLIIEGKGNFTKVHPNSLRGFILSISLNYKIPIIFTKNEEETAIYLALLSKKQEKGISLNPTKSNLSEKQQLEYILESFPNIGPITSKKLLSKFKNLKTIFNSEEEKLKPFLGKNSWNFLSILNSKY